MTLPIKLRSKAAAVTLVAALAAFPAMAQTAPHTIIASGPLGRDSTGALSAIDDFALGLRWSLLLNDAQPAGPGRLVASPLVSTPNELTGASATPQRAGAEVAGVRRAQCVIRGGDTLVLEEHSAMADGQLEATALGPAGRGDALRVRLKMDGRIVSARALAPGRAVLAPPEAW